MKLVKVIRDGRAADGVLTDQTVAVVGGWRDAVLEDFPASRLSIEELRAAVDASSETVTLDDVELALPFDSRNMFLLVGGNYDDHLAEYLAQYAKVHGPEAEAPKEMLNIERPVLLMRHPRSFAGPSETLVKPRISDSFDYEAELAVVIGKPARHVSPADALDYVLGYACCLDGSVRDHSKLSSAAGKTFLRSGAFGPWIVTRDEAPDWTDMVMETRINGETLQSTRVEKMTFDIPTIVAYCSTITELRPGDVIATGTPGGVGIFRDPQRWIVPGDVVEVDISGVGVLRNPVVAE